MNVVYSDNCLSIVNEKIVNGYVFLHSFEQGRSAYILWISNLVSNVVATCIIGFDTAENEPSKGVPCFLFLAISRFRNTNSVCKSPDVHANYMSLNDN